MDLQIKGKKALLAGGSAGMGRATAERLAEARADLFLSARGEQRLMRAAREIGEQFGVNVTPVVADSSTDQGRAALFDACPEPDILVMTIKPPEPNGDYLKVTPAMWRASTETALIGPIEIMRHYIPQMTAKGWGRILNIATFSAKNPMIWRLMSGPARSALLNYTASVSRKIARSGVIMNNILPGMFLTEGASDIFGAYAAAFGLPADPDAVRLHFLDNNRIPAGFIGQPDDMASLAALLCSPLARFIVGQNIVVDGGQYISIF